MYDVFAGLIVCVHSVGICSVVNFNWVVHAYRVVLGGKIVVMCYGKSSSFALAVTEPKFSQRGWEGLFFTSRILILRLLASSSGFCTNPA